MGQKLKLNHEQMEFLLVVDSGFWHFVLDGVAVPLKTHICSLVMLPLSMKNVVCWINPQTHLVLKAQLKLILLALERIQ